MNNSIRKLAIIATIVLASVLPAAMSGAAGSSPLRVSENGRMLVDATGKPVFLLTDTAWSLAFQLSREDAEMYLAKRRTQRFNAVAFVLCAAGHTGLTPRPTNFYGDAPFEMTSGRFDPTRPIVTSGNRPASPPEYDYWDNVDHLVALTRRLGFYAIILPTWGSGVTGSYSGTQPEETIFNEANAHVYGRWLGARYRDESHVIWMLGGDRSAVYGKADYRAVFRAMARGIAEAAPGSLMSYHPRKTALQSSAWFHHDGWLSFNSVQEWPEFQLANMAQDWALRPVKPTWLFEGRYEGYWKSNYKAEDWGEWQIRQQAYQTILAGAFGHTYGHERIFGFGTDGVDWKAHLDAPGARSMTHLADFMNRFAPDELLSRRPAPELVAGHVGTAERLKSSWIGAANLGDGRAAIFYSASGGPIAVRLNQLPAGTYFGWWFDPRSGLWSAGSGVAESTEAKPFARDIGAGPGSLVREFTPPSKGDGNDWMLVLANRATL